MKSSTLLALAALILPGASSAQNGFASRDGRGVAAPVRLSSVRRPAVEQALSVRSVTAQPGTPAERVSAHAYRMSLAPGCARLVAVGDNTVRDLAIELRGPATMRLRQDGSRGPLEVLSLCAPQAGTYEITVEAKGSSAAPVLDLRLRVGG